MLVRRFAVTLVVALAAVLAVPAANAWNAEQRKAMNTYAGQVSRYYLALDQGMLMAALANELGRDRLQRYFSGGAIERTLKPLMAMEVFTASPATR
ncbi:MAG: hypothetical protein H0U90_02590 [Actinobacteria bacterium]|nr:hypothetical protein [Actinomycetota bacterium]